MKMSQTLEPSPRVPFNTLDRVPDGLRQEIGRAIARVIDRGYFIQGPEQTAFEEEFAKFCTARHAIGVANGTDALELALRALGIGAGDEVVTVPNAGGYATSAIVSIGATPVFCDVDPVTLTLDAGSLSAVLQPAVKAVIVTHLYGFCADIEPVRVALNAANSSAAVIEDSAQAHGATRHGKMAGAFGDLGTFSFYPTKNLGAAGDAGAIVTSRDDLAARIRQLRQYGWAGKYQMEYPGGRNSRLDEIQAAILRAKLPYVPAWNERRRTIAGRYAKALAKSAIAFMHAEPGPHYVAHLAVARHPERTRLLAQLDAAGVGCQVHFPVADHRQHALARTKWRAGDLRNAERACQTVFSLPCFPEMNDAEIDQTTAALKALKV